LSDSNKQPTVGVATRMVEPENGHGRKNALQMAVYGSRSSKMEAILAELEKVWEGEADSKVLVFSQFLGFLDLMEREFVSRKISFARLDGKLNLKERMAVIQQFGSVSTKSKSTTRGSVLLISMKAGGVGLNLVSANTVFIAGTLVLVVVLSA
jgi:SNF2 family DNA or RNA helicase